MNFSYHKKKYNSFQEKMEILSVTSYFFIIISKCYDKPNFKKIVKIDYFDEINFFAFLQAFFFFSRLVIVEYFIVELDQYSGVTFFCLVFN